MRNALDLPSRWRIKRLIRDLDPGVVQTYMGRATRMVRLPRGRVPVHLARLGNFYRLRAYRHCHHWIGNTRGICDYLVRGGFPADRVHQIYNFVDPPPPAAPSEIEAVRERLGIREDALVLLSLGRFVPIKGFDDLVRAFAEVPPEVGERPVVLVLLGEGPQRPDLEALVEELGLGPRVCWGGWTNETGPYFALADLVVFPAKREEPFGNVSLESWAHGRPLLVTDFEGAREYVRPGADALMVPCERPAALASAMTDLLRDDEARERLATNGLTRVRSDFSEEKIVGEYLALYDRLARDPG